MVINDLDVCRCVSNDTLPEVRLLGQRANTLVIIKNNVKMPFVVSLCMPPAM